MVKYISKGDFHQEVINKPTLYIFIQYVSLASSDTGYILIPSKRQNFSIDLVNIMN